MGKITVLYPIEVPNSKYCVVNAPRPYPLDTICEYFDNEGGISNCKLDFDIGVDTDEGTLKADTCLSLLPLKGYRRNYNNHSDNIN